MTLECLWGKPWLPLARDVLAAAAAAAAVELPP